MILRKLRILKKLVQIIFSKLGMQVSSNDDYQILLNKSRTMDFLFKINGVLAGEVLKNCKKSKSQLSQDLFVLSQLNFKKNGYFVEIGASDGLWLSNTYLMETEFNWRGILVEPAKYWQDSLRKNRNCSIENLCVLRRTGEFVSFLEAYSKELSTVEQYADKDAHGKFRLGNVYFIETISLNDLLIKHNAPKNIDYLSIDTEGSEFDILSSFNFDLWKIKVITVEHNFSENREKIYLLLRGHGFKRIFEDISMWDDWYVQE